MYHSSIEDAKNNVKEKKERKPKKKTQAELFEKPKGYKNISSSEMKKLKDHSKMHKGGMNSKHIKNMIKFMKKGDSFSKAHKEAKKLD